MKLTIIILRVLNSTLYLWVKNGTLIMYNFKICIEVIKKIAYLKNLQLQDLLL